MCTEIPPIQHTPATGDPEPLPRCGFMRLGGKDSKEL